MADTRLHFVLGKGGVGKSTIAAALALAARRDGGRVLAIELGAPGGVSRAFGVTPGAPGTIARAPCEVSVMVIDGAAALSEYLMRKVRLGPLVERVLAHPLYTAFVDAAPGVKELLAIGKIQDEVRLQKRWDTVVVDAGASGHALELLRMPSAAAATFRAGRVHRESKRIHALIADERRTTVHVVATAEEMPVAEAIDSIARLVGGLGLPVARPIVDLCIEPAPPGTERALGRLAALPLEDAVEDRVREGMVVSVRRGIGRSGVQEAAIARLADGTGLVPLRIPRLTGSPFGMPQLEQLADLLAEEAQ